MSSAISSALSLPSAAAASTVRAAAARHSQQPNTQQVITQQGRPSTDTVRLSELQQVYQLYNQGLQASQIASNLSISVSEVDTYLGVSSG